VKGGDFSVIGAFHTFVWKLHFSLSPLWQLTTSCISTVFFSNEHHHEYAHLQSNCTSLTTLSNIASRLTAPQICILFYRVAPKKEAHYQVISSLNRIKNPH